MISQSDGNVPLIPTGSEPEDDPRVMELVKEYQAEWETGKMPNRNGYLARYPELAQLLAGYLDGVDMLQRGARALSTARHGRGRLETGLTQGDRLGEYELIREIGRGGMGVVYEARQISLKRTVAVKVLPAAFAADRTRLQRFTVEAQAAAAVAHPNIVPVYAIGEDRGIPYYVMRLVDGISLDVLAAGVSTCTNPQPGQDTQSHHPNSWKANSPPRSPSNLTSPEDGGEPTPNRLLHLARQDRDEFHWAIARLGSQVARALDHAHQCGVVHRDVKPANLLLDRNEHVWVTDFGLAQFAEKPSVTRTGVAIGTLRYVSPEQAAGDRRRLDHRTDVYSLGVTLYELLTGHAAFASEVPATLLRQIANEDPPTPRSIDPTIPRDLETVLLKAMQKDSRDRYATAADFADDLDRFLAGDRVTARRPWAWDRAKKWASRHPTAVAVTLASMLVVAAASGVATAMVATEQQETQRAYQETQRAYQQADRAYLAADALAKAERERADEVERRFRRSKELGDLVLRISEEEIGSDSPFQGPRRRLLLAALQNYRELLATWHDPNVRAELDKILVRVQTLLAEQDLRRDAEGAFLLTYTDVRTELGLSADQIKRVDRVYGRSGSGSSSGSGGHGVKIPIPGLSRPSLQGPNQETRLELIRNLNLSGLQRQRLRQILFQFRGPMAFSEPEVAEVLDLSPTQRQNIKTIQTEGSAWLGPFVGPAKLGMPGSKHPSGPTVMERILEVLTPEQRETWRTFLGKSFSLNR